MDCDLHEKSGESTVEVTSTTLNYYKENVDEFYESTVIADVTSLRERFIKYLPESASVLDFGCGSGRDTKAFLDEGFDVTAIDGSHELCIRASQYSGIEVKCMDFFELNDKERFDGIWACASVLHVDIDRIPELLAKMRDALVSGGVIYLSFKYGSFAGMRNERYFVDLDEYSFRRILSQVSGFEIIDEWKTSDVRKDKDVDWLNEILRRD